MRLTITESSSHDNVRRRSATGTQVDQRQEKGGQGESAQTERGRVGELLALGDAEGTRAQLTTEGREALGRGGVLAGERVSTIVVAVASTLVGVVHVVGCRHLAAESRGVINEKQRVYCTTRRHRDERESIESCGTKE